MLDSNVLIAVALAGDAGVRARLAAIDEGDAVTSSIAYAEVLYGSIRGKRPRSDLLASLIEEVPVLPFDDRAARVYARLPFKRASYDHLIAAHAVSLGLTVVTYNIRHFAELQELQVESWGGHDA